VVAGHRRNTSVTKINATGYDPRPVASLTDFYNTISAGYSGVPRGGGGVGGFTPPEIPKALQNRAKLNSIVKTVKNCWI